MRVGKKVVGFRAWSLCVGVLAAFGCSDTPDRGEYFGSSDQELTGYCSATFSVSPQPRQPNLAGGVTMTGSASCVGSEPLEYRFRVMAPRNNGKSTPCDWQASSSCDWDTSSLTQEGNYKLLMEVRRAGHTDIDVQKALRYAVGSACPAVTVGLSPSVPEPGDLVTFTAAATCDAGIAPEYLFEVRKPGTTVYEQLGTWQTSPQQTWSSASAAAGAGDVRVTVRKRGYLLTEAEVTTPFKLGGANCTAASIKIGKVGPDFALSATSTCTGGGVPEYRFEDISPDGTTQVLVTGSPSPQTVWHTAALTGTHLIRALVKAQGTSQVYSYKQGTRHFADSCMTASVTAPASVAPGATATFTASAGCSNPEYQFQVKTSVATSWTRVCAYSTSPTCDWAPPADAPLGPRDVRVLVRAAGTTIVPSEGISEPVTFHVADAGGGTGGTSSGGGATGGGGASNGGSGATSGGGAAGSGGTGGTAADVTWLGPCNPLGLSNDGMTVLAEQGVWRESTGWQAPPELAGGSVQSTVRALSADGNVVFGSSSSAIGNELYRWTIGGAVEPFGVTYTPLATNLDGTVMLALDNDSGGTPLRWTPTGGFAGLAHFDEDMSPSYMEAQLSEAGDVAYFTQDRMVWPWTLSGGLELSQDHFRNTALTGDGRKPARLFLFGEWDSIEGTGTCLSGGGVGSLYMAPPDSCDDNDETVVITDFDATGKRAVGIEYHVGDPYYQFFWSEAHGMRKLRDVLPPGLASLDRPPTADRLDGQLRHGPFVSADGHTVLAQDAQGACFLAPVETEAPVYQRDPDGSGPEPSAPAIGPLEWLGQCNPVDISDDGKTLLSDNGWWKEGSGWHGLPELPLSIADRRQTPAALSGDGNVVYGSTFSGSLYRWTEATGVQMLGRTGFPYATNTDGSVMVGISNGTPFSYTVSGGYRALTRLGGTGSLSWTATAPFAAQITSAGDLAYFSSKSGYASWHLGDSTFKVLSTSKIATALSGDGQVLKLINATGTDTSSTGACLDAPCSNARVALLELDATGAHGVGNEYSGADLVHSFYWTAQGEMQELDAVVPQNKGVDVYPGSWIDNWDVPFISEGISWVHPQLSRNGKYLFARDQGSVCFRLDLSP